jgi:hypothetical protein
MTRNPYRIQQLRGCPHGQLLVMQRKDDSDHGLVYNTIGMNRCPLAAYEAIDTYAVARETESEVVWKHPRGFWTMDALTITLMGEPRELGGLMFNFVARREMPVGSSPAPHGADPAFRPSQISHVTTYEFLSGLPAQLLRSPDGVIWVMQTCTRDPGPDGTSMEVGSLGDGLALPDGWRYRAAILSHNLVVETIDVGAIVLDNLGNTYLSCGGGASNFDPWD